jgi:DmsE family decaheme c-type cytochrome
MTPRLLLAAVLAAALAAVPARAEEPPPAAAAPAAGAPAAGEPAPTFAGTDVCGACHPDQLESFQAGPHSVLADEARPQPLRGCEACHGPGSAHAEAGGGKGVGNLHNFGSGESSTERSAVCLKCHGGNNALHDFRGGEHALAGLACPDCHKIHPGVGRAQLRAEPPKLCYGCHLEVRAKFSLPEHHKVNEGVVSCLDCHQQHGSRTRAMLHGPNDRPCFRCHGEYEGPYVFPHEALLAEGCQRCHDPHGSVNRHLLIRQQVAQLCYECHTVTPSNHLQPSFRDCTRCHVAIHGSNVDPRFLEQ